MKLFSLTLILFFIFGASNCTMPDDDPIRLSVHGDSHALSWVGPTLGINGEGFAQLLEQEEDYEVIIGACGGSRCLEWEPIDPFPHLCGPISGGPVPGGQNLYQFFIQNNMPVDFLFFIIGTVDATDFRVPETYEGPTDPEVFKQEVGSFALSAIVSGAGRVVLITPPPVHTQHINYVSLQNNVDLLTAKTLELCNFDPNDLIDCIDISDLDDSHMGFKDIHLNAAGHLELKNRIINYLDNLPE